ncbi:IS30 family transposase [Rhodococcus qingshengii]|uniref:IS30 family transposase n=1 Tax=Rhodococcus qingshengii TaxID=334542 RepID=UPI003ECBE2B4
MAIPSEPSNAAGRPEPYPLPEGDRDITTHALRNHPLQQRKEGDLIVGPNHCSAIGTLVERQTRAVRLVHLPSRDSDTLRDAVIARMADLPRHLVRSITWDQGTEMARHTGITAALKAPVYFCDSHSPWQRGTNENTNGLLRDYFPKRTDLSVHSPDHLAAFENELNHRPPMILQDRSPAELFTALLRSEPSSVLQC